jgi:ATP-dependent phosphofructokinase / diphosphate-dependent phosphofructokinase
MTSADIRKIGVLTGGGDAPGLNSVIRAVVLTAQNTHGWEVVGIREGFDGLLAGSDPIPLSVSRVQELLSRGGTILGAVNRGNPFINVVENAHGAIEYLDSSATAVEQMQRMGLDALIVAGGDGTMAIAQHLIAQGARIVGVPKTIDNDLSGTDVTFGFDTAILTATEALDKLRTTAESHHRAMVMEVMGRNAGWIALMTGIAGGADAILIPEIPFDIRAVCEKVDQVMREGRRYSLIVVAEGAAPIGGQQEYYIKAEGLSQGRLGGMSYIISSMLADCVTADVRTMVLGHLQRGGSPTPHDRILATRFGNKAVHLVAEQAWGHMVALKGDVITSIPMSDATRTMKAVDPQGDLVRMARDLGIVFG